MLREVEFFVTVVWRKVGSVYLLCGGRYGPCTCFLEVGRVLCTCCVEGGRVLCTCCVEGGRVCVPVLSGDIGSCLVEGGMVCVTVVLREVGSVYLLCGGR